MKKFLLAFFGGIFTTLLAALALHKRTPKQNKESPLQSDYDAAKKEASSILPKPLPEDATQIEQALKERGFIK